MFAAALKAGLDTGATHFHLLVSSKNDRARRLYAKYGFVDSAVDFSQDTTHDKIMVCADLQLGTIQSRLDDRLAAIKAEPSKRVRVPTTIFDPADNRNDTQIRLAQEREPLEDINGQPTPQEGSFCKRKRRASNKWGRAKGSRRKKAKKEVVDATVGEAAVAQAEDAIKRRADQPVEVGQYVAAVFEDDNGIQQISYGLCVAMERRPQKPGNPVKPRKITEVQRTVLSDEEVWLQCSWMRVAKHGSYRFNPTRDDEDFFQSTSFLSAVSMMRLGPACWKLEAEDRREMGVIMTARRYLKQPEV